MGIEPRRAGKSEPAKEFAKRMKEIHEEAGTALSKAQDNMTCYADRHRGSAPEYKIGNKVWLSTKDIKINRPSQKLTERQLGPFEIIKVISPNAVKLNCQQVSRPITSSMCHKCNLTNPRSLDNVLPRLRLLKLKVLLNTKWKKLSILN